MGPKKGIVIKSESNPTLLMKLNASDELTRYLEAEAPYLRPASMTSTEVCFVSANLAAITFPAVPAIID